MQDAPVPLGTLRASLVVFSFPSPQMLGNQGVTLPPSLGSGLGLSVLGMSEESRGRRVEWGEEGVKGALMRCWVFAAGQVTPWW